MSPFVGRDGPMKETRWGCVWLWFSSEGFCLFACLSKPNCLVSWWLKSLLEEGQTPKGPGLVVVDKNLEPASHWALEAFTGHVVTSTTSLLPPIQLTSSTYFTFQSLRRGHLLFHFLFF